MVSVLSMLNGSFYFRITDTTYNTKFNDRFIPHHKVFIRDIDFDLVNLEIADLPAAVVGKKKSVIKATGIE